MSFEIPSEKSRRFLFRLRTFLLVLLLSATALGWLVGHLKDDSASGPRTETTNLIQSPPGWSRMLRLAERQARLRPDTLDDREQKLAEEIAARRELGGGLQGSSDAAPDPAFARP